MAGSETRLCHKGTADREDPSDDIRPKSIVGTDFENMLVCVKTPENFPVYQSWKNREDFAYGVGHQAEGEDIRRNSFAIPSPKNETMADHASRRSSSDPYAHRKLAVPEGRSHGVEIGPVGMGSREPNSKGKGKAGYQTEHEAGYQVGQHFQYRNVSQEEPLVRSHVYKHPQDRFPYSNHLVDHLKVLHGKTISQINDEAHLARYVSELADEQDKNKMGVHNVQLLLEYSRHGLQMSDVPVYPQKLHEDFTKRDLRTPVTKSSIYDPINGDIIPQHSRAVETAASYKSPVTPVGNIDPGTHPAGGENIASLIQRTNGVSGSKPASETTSNGGLSKNSSEKTGKVVVLNLKRWLDGSLTSQIERVPEVELCEEKSLVLSNMRHIENIRAAMKQELDRVETNTISGARTSFRPSDSVLQGRGAKVAYRLQGISHRYGCSDNYMGDISIASNRSADISSSENCALWILGLPACVTHKELLSSIRNTGQIYASVINPPDGKHRTSAAKIVFFERFQAERLMNRILDERSFSVMGKRIRDIRWNKIKSPRYPHSAHSRAIRITGPRKVMDFAFFEDFFDGKFTYEIESREEVACPDPNLVSHEWRFGSLRSQAESAKTAIQREFSGVVKVEWVQDPCA